MRVALSTMWAQQDRFRGQMQDFARIAREAGYTAIEPSHSTDKEGLERLLECGILPLASLHAPTPRQRDARGRWNTDLNLAAIDERERSEAITATCQTIDYAARAGAAAVVVHLGACGESLLSAERELRARYRAGDSDADRPERLRLAAEADRARLALLHLPQARRSLEALADYADRAGVALGLENRLHYHEIPRFDEVPGLLAPYPRTLVGYWHDVGHAEVQHRLGLVDLDAWLRMNGERTIGCHLHDVAGIVDHRAPGQGDVDWSYIAHGIPVDALHTVEINQHEPEPLLSEALRYLAEREVIAPEQFNERPRATNPAYPA